MLILGIDTSTDNCSVGLVENGKIVGKKSLIGNSIHSEKLIDLINNLFNDKVDISDLDAIAVSIGPGSYTGLRIGLSTAKGLAMPERLPIIPVSTLKVLESVTRDEIEDDVLLFIKSHKDLIYYTVSIQSDGGIGLQPEIFYDKFESAISNYPHIKTMVGNSYFHTEDAKRLYIRYPSGEKAALIAYKYYDKLLTLSKPELEPEYLIGMEIDRWGQR